MKKYKLRAECMSDVIDFLIEIQSQLKSFTVTKDNELPDCELEFETELELDEIIFTLQDLEDSHVMYQSCNYLGRYTGLRNYNL